MSDPSVFSTLRPPATSTLFPYTTLFRSVHPANGIVLQAHITGYFIVEKQLPVNEIRITQDGAVTRRSEEHTSELQSRGQLVCRLLLEKKNTIAVTQT